MTALVRRWETGGETQAVFAARYGVSQAKFRYWVPRVMGAPAAAMTFAPVQIRDAAGSEVGDIEVALATGVRVVIHAGASADLVGAVVAALRSPC